jgi:hypothetical protein
VRGSNIERIDASAVLEIIKGLRVYTNGIADLLDFRTECLHGLSISKRKSLTLSQIAQLYVCVFQHDSIWEQCWQAVVPVMNHTIISSRDKFRQGRVFDTAAVVRNIIDCHVNTGESASVRKEHMPQRECVALGEHATLE